MFASPETDSHALTIEDLKSGDQAEFVGAKEGWNAYRFPDGETILSKKIASGRGRDEDIILNQFLDKNGNVIGESKHNTTNRSLDPQEFVARFLEPSNFHGVVLDVGCGFEGKFVQGLRDLGVAAFGIDLTVSRENPVNKNTTWGSIHRTGLKSTSVDVITASRVFDKRIPVEVGQKMVAELSRILKPGGSLYLLDFAPADQEWLEKVLDGSGFTVQEETYELRPALRLTKTAK